MEDSYRYADGRPVCVCVCMYKRGENVMMVRVAQFSRGRGHAHISKTHKTHPLLSRSNHHLHSSNHRALLHTTKEGVVPKLRWGCRTYVYTHAS